MRLEFTATEPELTVFARHNATVDSIKQLMFDLARKKDIVDEDGTVISTRKANDTLRAFSRDFVGLPMDGNFSHRDFKRTFENGAMRRYFDLIEEVVDETLDVGYHDSEWFNELVDYRNEALGDTTEFWCEDDQLILDVAVVGMSHHDYILQRPAASHSYTVPQTRYGAAVGIDLNRYFVGNEDFATLITMLTKSIQMKTQAAIFGCLADAVQKIPVKDGFVGNGALDREAFDEIVDGVSAVYGDALILGTKNALRKIRSLAEVEWVDEGTKRDVMAMGRLGSYFGTRLVEIPQRFADKGLKTKLMDDKKLYILPATDFKIIDFVTKGETEIDEITEKGEKNGRMDDLGKYEIQFSQGIAVKANKQFGVWTLA